MPETQVSEGKGLNAFLKWFFAFITNILEGIWSAISGFFKGIGQIFNFSLYSQLIKQYSSEFGVAGWICAVLAILLVLAILGLLTWLLILATRKYIRFRHSRVSQEDVLEELADLHRQILKLNEEKERILALQVSQLGVPTGDVEAVVNRLRDEIDADARDVTDALPEKADSALITDLGVPRFFRLAEVDEKYKNYLAPDYKTDFDLARLCEMFRNFACSKMRLYYDLRTIQLFFSGLASTKLILLQGISGTGKTSLPYSMGKFFKHDATIASVQPSWRDRTELFGYFNEFTKKFNETEVLRRIYEASFNDDVNLIILDEMNIARVEYYFAEMLSILEMPDPSEWKLDLVPNSWASDPVHLPDGKLQIPQNVWYIGTANNDDSTFAVSDKVYDRALVINLDSKGVAFDAPDQGPCDISYSYVEKLYQEAIEANPVSQEILDNIAKLDIYVISKFRIAFGNRIMKQLKMFVPVFVACGGTEVGGVDYILATKVFRKFESLNLSMIRDEIKGLILYLEKMFGKGNMVESIAYLERLQKMF